MHSLSGLPGGMMRMAASMVFGQHRKDVDYVPNNIVFRYVIDFFRCYQRLMKPCSDGKDSNSIFSGLPSMLFQESMKPPALGSFRWGYPYPLLDFHRSLCNLSAPKPVPRGYSKTVGPSSYHVLESILSLGDMIVKSWECIPCSRDRGGLGFGLCTSPKIQFSHSVHFVTAALVGRGYPYPLTVFKMKQDSFVVGTISELFENWDQVVKIVSTVSPGQT
jgi:hypothetical protein